MKYRLIRDSERHQKNKYISFLGKAIIYFVVLGLVVWTGNLFWTKGFWWGVATLVCLAVILGLFASYVMPLLLGILCIIFAAAKILFSPFLRLAAKAYKSIPTSPTVRPTGFSLWLGRSTGHLATKNHTAGIAPEQDIYLMLPDACQNIVTIGGIGSGKTTRIVQPVLYQLLQQDCGGLIFDIKADFCKAVTALASRTGRKVEIIGVNQRGVNLVEGLSPEMSSSFLKSAFYLSGSGLEAFWIDTATELCKNSLGVLSFCPGCYSLDGLYRFIFFPDERQELIEIAKKNSSSRSPEEARLLDTYIGYYDRVFMKFGDKVIQGVLATVAQVLSPFQHPVLIDSFCKSSRNKANIEDVLNGAIYLVNLPLTEWGLGAKVIYTFIKLRFFNVLQSRQARSSMNQERPVFFMCDEYQEIISANKSGLSDLNFWDKSRSARCIGIISAQSVNSFRAAIGDRTLADTVLQNFRQKIFFRSEDLETIHFMNNLAGKAEVQRESFSAGTSTSQRNTDFVTATDSSSSGYSTSWVERPVVDAPLIRELGSNHAIAFLNIAGQAMDDVIILEPLFVD